MRWAIYIADYPNTGDKTWCYGTFTSDELDEYGYRNKPRLFSDINEAHRHLALSNQNIAYVGQYRLIEYPPSVDKK